jgi:exodeoxyribonuclease VII small subunit
VSERSAQGTAGEFADLGYEEGRDQLVEVVRRLEAGGITLEESLALWERGEALAARCEQWLAGARARVEAVTAAREEAAPGR